MILSTKTAYLFFFVLIVISLFTFKNYGVGWDENAQIEIGRMSYNYIVNKDTSINQFTDRDYGVGFELPVYAASTLIKSPSNIYYFRHFCVHFFFLIGLWFFYKAQLLFFKNESNKYVYSLLTILIIVLSPRIWADSFYNSKDIILLAASCINFYTLLLAIEKPTKRNWILHSFTSAFLLDIRIIGLINIAITLGVVLFKLIIEKRNRINWLYNILIFVLLTPVLLYFMWPYLYEHPFQNIQLAFINMSHFRWNCEVLFLGKTYKAIDLPSYYLPLWIVITTPIIYLILFFLGVFFTVKKFITKHFFQLIVENNSIYLLITLALSIGPLLAVVILKSTVYDAWRQLFYIYPYIILIAVFGVATFFKLPSMIFKKVLLVIISVQMILVSVFMIKNHSNENVYFNELVSHKESYLLDNFELDYWGISYKQALEHTFTFVKTNKDTVRILCHNTPGMNNVIFIPDSLKNNILVYKLEDTDDSLRMKMNYFITNYRWATHHFPKCTEKIWSKNILNSDIIAIYDLSQNRKCYE